jgi:gamma-glutamyltranspeptidase/glutathione hydrolase
MTLQDLKDYKVEVRNSINITYRGYTLHSCGTPSGGSIALSILKSIEGYNMSEPSLLDLDTHRLDEAMRFSYAAHAELGDPFMYPDIEAFEESIISEENAKAIRGKILDNKTQNVSAYQPKMWAPQDNHGTSHIVATDSSGLSISSTSTVNLLFGSMVMVPENGTLFAFLLSLCSVCHHRLTPIPKV